LIVECTYHIFGTKIGRSRKASNTQYREIHDNSSIFKWYSLMQARIKEMKQANHNKIMHLMISDIHFIWVKDGIHCLHQAIIIGLHDASWRTKLESNDYPLLQHSKVKLLDICIHYMLRTWLVHIVIYSDHSWKIK